MRGFWIAGLALALASPARAEGEAAPAAPPRPEASPAQPDAPKPAEAPAARKAPSPTVPPSSERFVFVPTAVDRAINFVTQLHPDCTPLGTTDYRVEAKPQHGTVSFQQGDNFSSYPMGSPLQRCNDKKSTGLFTHYTSADGYVGEDHVDVLYLLPSATAVEVRYTIVVK